MTRSCVRMPNFRRAPKYNSNHRAFSLLCKGQRTEYPVEGGAFRPCATNTALARLQISILANTRRPEISRRRSMWCFGNNDRGTSAVPVQHQAVGQTALPVAKRQCRDATCLSRHAGGASCRHLSTLVEACRGLCAACARHYISAV